MCRRAVDGAGRRPHCRTEPQNFVKRRARGPDPGTPRHCVTLGYRAQLSNLCGPRLPDCAVGGESLAFSACRIRKRCMNNKNELRKEPNVQFQTECVASDEHLIVGVAGEWTEESFRRLIDTACDQATQLGLNRIFLDMRAVSRPDAAITRYLSGIYVAKTIGSRFRMAALGAPENVTRYGETVARNRGCNFRVFTDDNQAMGWLLNA